MKKYHIFFSEGNPGASQIAEELALTFVSFKSLDGDYNYCLIIKIKYFKNEKYIPWNIKV